MNAVFANQQRTNNPPRRSSAPAKGDDQALVVGAIGLLLIGCVGGWVVGAANLVEGARTAAFVIAGVCTGILVAIAVWYVCSNRKSMRSSSTGPGTTSAHVGNLPLLVTLPV